MLSLLLLTRLDKAPDLPQPPKRKRGRPSNASKLLEQQRLDHLIRQHGPNSEIVRQFRAALQGKRRSSGGKSTSNDSRSIRRQHYDDDEDDEETQIRSERRQRPSGAAPVIGRRGIPQPARPGSQTQKTQKQKAVRDRDEDEQSSDPADVSPPASPPKPYTHVAPHVRRVRQSAIDSKWAPLGSASVAAASSVLELAQRPVLQRLSDTQQRRALAANALRAVSDSIARRINKGLPFPPGSMPAPVGRAPLQSDGGRDVELNFESVLDGKQSLERQLEPALDGLEVLRRERDVVEHELALDYETLRNLETGARAQAREQRNRLKKAHVLTPASGVAHTPEDDDYEMELASGEQQGSAFAVGFVAFLFL